MNQAPLVIRQMELGMMANFVYIIGCKDTKEAAVVDPGWDVNAILKQAQKDGLTIKKIFLTHTHFDHCNGVGELLDKTDAKVYIHKVESGELRFAEENVVATAGGDEVPVGNIKVKFVHTPGHTRGSQCFYVENNLISGDTLFINACGRTDLPGGSPEELYTSLMLLKKMPDKTILFPGHNYGHKPASTIGEEKHSNPFMVAGNLKDFLRFMGC